MPCRRSNFVVEIQTASMSESVRRKRVRQSVILPTLQCIYLYTRRISPPSPLGQSYGCQGPNREPCSHHGYVDFMSVLFTSFISNLADDASCIRIYFCNRPRQSWKASNLSRGKRSRFVSLDGFSSDEN